MRGKVHTSHQRTRQAGITPAYAGKSGPCPDRVPPAGDHPRVCGEKSQSTSASPRALGSPPRMRGKGVKQSNSRIRMGITPAYAGKRGWKNCIEKPLGDHPRVCGEKKANLQNTAQRIGSPPRMRGKAVVILLCVATFRITPAYAGKSLIHRVCTDRHRDHPRVCGEKKQLHEIFRGAWGSPPRMRGKD